MTPLPHNADDDESDGEHRQKKLFAAAIISTGLTFRKVQELFLKAHMEMPIREDQFYRYQSKFIEYIAGYV